MPVTHGKPRGFLAVRPVTCPPRQAPAVPVPDLGRPSPRLPSLSPPPPRPGLIACPGRHWPSPFLAGPPRPARNGVRGSPPRRGRSPALPGRPRPLHLGPGRPSPRPSGTRRGSPPRPGRAPATNRHPTSSIAPAMCPRASPRAGVTPRTPLPYATSPKFFPDAPSGTPIPLAVETSGPRPSYADRRNFFFAPVRRAGTAKGSSRGEFTWKCVPAWSRRPCCPRAGAGPC